MKRKQMKRKQSTLAFLAVAGLILFLPMGLDAQPKTSRGMSPNARAHLQEKVRHELVMLPYYGVFDWMTFEIHDDYSVTLNGQVVRPTLRSDAEHVVKKVEGVERVNNRIEVLPLSSYDDRIRLAVYRSIFSTVGLDRYGLQPNPPIHILVKGGHVTLVGLVRTQADKNIAGIRANQVSGVFSVTNQLAVEKPEKS